MSLRLRVIALALAVVLGVPVVIGTAVVVYRTLTRTTDDSLSLPIIPPFGRVRFSVDGRGEYCALLAETQAAQQEGMQRKSSLMGYDAMIFAFAQPTTVNFINHFVPIDLSIGWYDADGVLVDQTTMQACPTGDNCPTYASKDPFSYAVETPVGGLGALGLTHTGAVLHVGGGCPA